MASALAQTVASTTLAQFPHMEHYAISEHHAFPRKDENDVCWQPADFDGQTGEQWASYENPQSELCAHDATLACASGLEWQAVSCESHPVLRAEEEEEWKLSLWIVVPVQILAAFVEWHVVLIMTLPWQVILFTISLVDYLLDWVFFLLFGWYCSFCAGIFIWIINIAHLPFTIWGWINRIFLETFGAIIDAWMLLFNWSGCYLFIGSHCWWWSDFSLYGALDIPWFTNVDNIPDAAQLIAKISPQPVESEDFWAIRNQARREFLNLMPIVRQFMIVSDAAQNYFEF